MTAFGLREATALTVGIPITGAALSWAMIGFLTSRGAPPSALWVAFEFGLAWVVAGLASGHVVSGFGRRALGVLGACLLALPVVHLLGWLLSGPIATWVGPHLTETARPMAEMAGYYMAITVMMTAVAEDLKQTWQRREGDGAAR